MKKNYTALLIALIAPVALMLVFSPADVCGDIFKLKTGESLEGLIIEETETDCIIKLKGGGTARYSKDLIISIIEDPIAESELYSASDIYYQKLQLISPDDAQANYELALWCLENGLVEVAIKHFKVARALDESLAEQIDNKLKIINNLKAERIYVYAEGDLPYGNYLEIERLLVDLIKTYPASDYATRAEDLLIIMWGAERARKVLTEDGLPPVALTSMELNGFLSRTTDEPTKKAYIKKCFEKAEAFEDRAKEVDPTKKEAYLKNARKIYNMLYLSGIEAVAKRAERKLKTSHKDILAGYPIPAESGDLADLCNALQEIEDKDFIENTVEHYYKLAQQYYEKAKKTRGSPRRENAQIAYNSYSIVYYFAGSQELKQSGLEGMRQSERLMR